MSDLLLLPAPAPAPIGGRLGFLAPVGRQLLRALPLSALVLGVAIVLNFALPRLAPGDPMDFLIPAEQASLVTPEQRQQLAASYGLDGSQWEQFTRYIANLAQGDLGTSTRHGRAVTSLLAERLPWTLLLVGMSVVLSTLIGAALGFRSAWRRTPAGASPLAAAMVT